MLTYKFKKPDNRKYISILGEIKTTRKSAHKNNDQRKDYINFIQEVNNLEKEEFMVLLYIYDHSFYSFKEEINNMAEKSEDYLPIIYSYIPKLYYEESYQVYNDLITELKSEIPPIDIKDKTQFKERKNRKQLIEEIKSLLTKNESLQTANESIHTKYIILEGIIVFIIAIFIYNRYFDWLLSKYLNLFKKLFSNL